MRRDQVIDRGQIIGWCQVIEWGVSSKIRLSFGVRSSYELMLYYIVGSKLWCGIRLYLQHRSKRMKSIHDE